MAHLTGHIPAGGRTAVAALASAALLAGCSADGLSPDEAEVANISRAHVVPKSAPAAFVKAFDRFCANAPDSASALEADLRGSNYVPYRSKPRKGVQVWVVDSKRPAVGVSETMCLVQARSRTGQTERVRRYVADTFPDARPTAPAPFGRDIEQAWALPGNRILATRRHVETGNISTYALILFHPDTPLTQ